MEHLSSASYHVTELSSGGGSRSGNGTVGPLFVVLAIIMVLGVVAGFIGRVCAGRHWGGDTQYDFEGWVEKRCASCIDGDIEAPPPPPPPEKPPEAEAPPAEAAPPAADAAAPPPPADGAPPPADAEERPPAADGAAAPAPAAEGEAAPAPAPAPAPADAPAAEAPAEAAPPPPSEPLPPPPPPPAPLEYAGSRTEPLTYMQLYPSYSCRCHICAREGIFE